ncbi:MAG: MBL fold metallo-hydrolase [Bacteroidales bacterium]
MIEFKSYFSGSTGNFNTCTDGFTTIAIDFGVPFRQAQKAIDYKVTALDGILSSHLHFDHCQGVPKAITAGVNCYATDGVFKHLGVHESHRAHKIVELKQFRINTLTILPFPLEHDVPNVGFLIQSDHGGKLVYITDTFYCKFIFKTVDIIAIEANYQKSILDENIASGLVPGSLRNRIIKSHFEIENVKAFLGACDLSRCREIHLIHISSTNGAPAGFVDEIRAMTGIPTYANGKRKEFYYGKF